MTLYIHKILFKSLKINSIREGNIDIIYNNIPINYSYPVRVNNNPSSLILKLELETYQSSKGDFNLE